MQDGVAMMMDMEMSVDGGDEIMNGDDGVAEMADLIKLIGRGSRHRCSAQVC